MNFLSMRKILKSAAVAALLSVALPLAAENVTGRNPIIWADAPDPDVIRVGDDFYMVTTTMHLMPGAPIMHSKDLIHWETINYIFDELTDSPKYSMEGGTVYGRGQWATSLQYHDGWFYALFAPNDNPGGDTYIYKVRDPRDKWQLVSRMRHFHDCALFFDDDNRVYTVSGSGNIHLQELRADLQDVKEGGVDVHLNLRDSVENGLLEGSRMVKHNGKYYLMIISWPQGGARRQLCYRADKITGPYEKKTVLLSEFAGFPYVGQGTIVSGPDGNWYGMIFQDRGGVGRVLTLSPCRWIDGWPMLGDENGKVPAEITVTGVKAPEKCEGIVGSDDFSSPKLKNYWEWNHNPVNAAWSLTERPGWLRLKTSQKASNVFDARNSISQRMVGPTMNTVVKMDISHMADGDVAGVSAFQGDAAVLQVERHGKQLVVRAMKNNVSLSEKDKVIENVTNEEVYSATYKINKVKDILFRVSCDFNVGKDIADLLYSTDNGKTWQCAVRDFKMCYDYRRLFMGTRFQIHCYCTRQAGGFVDVDYVHIDK